ncbi:TRAP transporter small permease [Bengtsoniella intestinalis]|uniref:TRAP transporter small permease n=1 Tax=Bengtsoniella intestinalis TaxID=3073143 RepID=UPI00391F8115
MQILTSIKRVLDFIISWFCIIVLAIMTVLVSYQVVTRFVFNNPSAVSEILAQYLFVWSVMLGSAYVFGMREHLSITILKDKMPPLLNMLTEILIAITLIAFSYGVCIKGGMANTVLQMAATDASLGIPMGVIYAVIPISGAFMVFYAIYNIALAVQEYKNHTVRKSDDTAGTM